MAFTLRNREGTCTFQKIMQGRRWIGRVYQHADGSWRAAINKREVGQGKTPVAAFEDGVSKFLGYENVHALDEHNRNVRARRRQLKAYATVALRELSRGNTKPLDKMLDGMMAAGTDGAVKETFGAIQKSIFGK